MSPLFPLLALVARADAYGYEIKRAIDAEFAPTWKIDFAQLYRSLAKLRAREWVRVRRAAVSGGPARQIYSITPRGRRALEKWFQTPADTPEEHWVQAQLAAALALESRLPLAISGSDDPLLAYLAQSAHTRTDVIGSTAGLLNLAAGKAEIIGTHLRDPEASGYNVSFVRHLVAEEDVLLINLALREYGLLVAPNTRTTINHIGDLARPGVRLVNRSRGSGARLWFQRHLRDARLDPTALHGWQNERATYAEVVHELETGAADVGPGLRATAQKFGLHFIPLGQERFDLACSRAAFESPRVQTFLHGMSSRPYRAFANTLDGYDLSQAGHVIAEIKYGEIQ